jgi:hypothetical protein
MKGGTCGADTRDDSRIGQVWWEKRDRMHAIEQHPQANPASHQTHPREDTPGISSEGSHPSKTAAHGQDLRRSPGLPDRGGLLAHAEDTTNPGGPTQRAPQRQAD